MNGKTKVNISPLTIISSIEKELKELQPELTKTQKTKIISIQESIKLLHKKLLSVSSNNNYQQEIKYIPSIIESSENSSKLDEEMNQIRQENIKLKSEVALLNHLLQDKAKAINVNESSINDFHFVLNEEKTKNNLLLLQVKTVEDNFKTLNKEYQALSEKHEKVLKDMESLCQVSSEMKRRTNDNKYKYGDLAYINSELKKKLLSYENNINTHNEDIKTLMKKNNTQKIRIEELEKVNKALNAEVNYKEERIKVIRLMNAKLESNTKKLINKWGSLSQIEEKNTQIAQEANEAFDSLREMNEHLTYESCANKNLQLQLQQAINNNQLLQKEIKNLNDINSSIKEMNKDLLMKNKELETRLEVEFKKKENNILSTTYKGNNLLSISNKNENNNSDMAMPLEKLQPAKLQLK